MTIKISLKKAIDLISNAKYVFTFLNGYEWLGWVNYSFRYNKKDYTLYIDTNTNIVYIKKDASNDINILICKYIRFWNLESLERTTNKHTNNLLCDFSNSPQKEFTIRNIHQVFRWLDNSILNDTKVNELKRWLIKELDKTLYLKDFINHLIINDLSIIFDREQLTLLDGTTISIYKLNKEEKTLKHSF